MIKKSVHSPFGQQDVLWMMIGTQVQQSIEYVQTGHM